MAWCLANFPGANLQTKAWSPRASTWETQRHACRMQWFSPRRSATATRTASSSRCRPQEAIGNTASQSPLCWLEADKNDAFCLASTKPDSTTFLSSRRPGLSLDDCLWYSSFEGGTTNEEDQRDKYISKMVSGGRCVVDKMDFWSDKVLITEAKKAGSASEATLLTPRPPSLIVRVAWIHCVSVKSELVMRFNVDRTWVSKTTRASWSTDGEQRSRCWTRGALKDARRSKRASWLLRAYQTHYYYYYYYACIKRLRTVQLRLYLSWVTHLATLYGWRIGLLNRLLVPLLRITQRIVIKFDLVPHYV